MGSQRYVHVESVSAARRGRRLPGALSLLVISVCILVAALFFGAVAPPPPAQAAGGHILGMVTNAKAVGLAGVMVTAYRSSGLSERPWAWVNDTRTAVDGSYDLGGLPAGSYRMELYDSSGNYVQQYYDNAPTIDAADDVVVAAGATRSGIDARLAVAGQVGGTVTNASAAGLGRIQVTAYRADRFGGWDEVNSTLTAADGSYELGGLPTGSYVIELRDDLRGDYVTQFYGNQPTFAAADDVAVTAGATTSGIDATLAAAGHVSGTVSNASAAGLGGINVTAYRDNGSDGWPWDEINDTQTAADGSYELGGLPAGSYVIKFRDDLFGAYVTQYYDDQPTLAAADAVVAVTAGATASGIDATLAVAGHVSGTVTNARGAGLGGISVTAYHNNGSSGWWPWDDVNVTQTAADGTYDLGGLPTGSYRIELYDDSGDYVEQFYDNRPYLDPSDDVAVTAGATTFGIDATLAAAGHVCGMVSNASGAGLARILVTAYSARGYGDWPWVWTNYAYTAADGTYDLGGLPAGSYRIEIYDGSGNYVQQYYNNAPTIEAADEVVVIAGATRFGIDATLAVAGHVSGTVTNGRAAGVGGIQVTAYRSDGTGAWVGINATLSTADGSYDLGGLPTGRYRIEFRDGSGAYGTTYYKNKPVLRLAADVVVIAGETTPGINATLSPPGPVGRAAGNARAAGSASAAYRMPTMIAGSEAQAAVTTKWRTVTVK